MKLFRTLFSFKTFKLLFSPIFYIPILCTWTFKRNLCWQSVCQKFCREVVAMWSDATLVLNECSLNTYKTRLISF